jgi:hypothetical protein
MNDERYCGFCKNIIEDNFRDKLHCKFDEADYHQGRKTNEVKKYWQPACGNFEPKSPEVHNE